MQDNTGTIENRNQQPGCLNCGSLYIEQGYDNPLCKDCREKLIKFPIPVAIKIFAIAVGAVLILSITRLSKNLSAGIHLKRGERAEKQANYLTAQREYEEVIKIIPGLLEAKCHLLIASFRNLDFATVIKTSQDLEGKEIKDQDLFRKVSSELDGISGYFPSDSFSRQTEKYTSVDSFPEEMFKKYIRSNPTELFPVISYANFLLDNNQLEKSDSLLNKALLADNKQVTALSLKTSLKRQRNQPDSAMFYCDRILELNRESEFGICSKARTFLKQKKDNEGLKWALKGYNQNNKDPYAIATLALAYHLTNKLSERDKLMVATEKDSLAAAYMIYVKDVMDGKEKFRD